MRTIYVTPEIIALLEEELMKKKVCKRKSAPKASKGKKKEVKSKKRRKKAMTQKYEVPVELDVLVVPRVYLRVAMQLAGGGVVELKPVPPPAEAPKADDDTDGEKPKCGCS